MATVPLGSLWDPTTNTQSNIFTPTEIANARRQAARVVSKKMKRKAKEGKKKKSSDTPPFHGD
jgi:hypothetical protein